MLATNEILKSNTTDKILLSNAIMNGTMNIKLKIMINKTQKQF